MYNKIIDGTKYTVVEVASHMKDDIDFYWNADTSSGPKYLSARINRTMSISLVYMKNIKETDTLESIIDSSFEYYENQLLMAMSEKDVATVREFSGKLKILDLLKLKIRYIIFVFKKDRDDESSILFRATKRDFLDYMVENHGGK